MAKRLQEDNLNLKGLALISLHRRTYITTTQRVENNIHSKLCLQGTACNYFIYALPSQRPKNTTGISLCCIKTAQEKYFQAACMKFPVYEDERNIFSFPQQAKHMHRIHQLIHSSTQFFKPMWQKSLFYWSVSSMAYCYAKDCAFFVYLSSTM